jgi:hypothetical protein
VVRTFKCMPPPDFTKSSRPIFIYFKKLCGDFVDHFDAVAYKIPITLLSKQLSKCYLFVYLKITCIILLLNFDPVFVQQWENIQKLTKMYSIKSSKCSHSHWTKNFMTRIRSITSSKLAWNPLNCVPGLPVSKLTRKFTNPCFFFFVIFLSSSWKMLVLIFFYERFRCF